MVKVVDICVRHLCSHWLFCGLYFELPESFSVLVAEVMGDQMVLAYSSVGRVIA